jgi:DNA-binding IclR family transcriptional regulator
MAAEPAGTVARAIQLLRVVAEAPEPQTVTGLAALLGLPSSTVHRLLQLLREQGMVEGDPATRRYLPGRELYRLASGLTARRSIVGLARPVLRRLAAASAETCVLGMPAAQRGTMTFVDQVESTRPLRISMPLHTPLPMVWGASGLSMVAMLPDVEADDLYAAAEPSPVSGKPVGSRAAFRARLAEIRTRGYAVSRAEKVEESVGVSAAVLDASARPVASVTLTVPCSRASSAVEREFGVLVAGAAAELSGSLGLVRAPDGHPPAAAGADGQLERTGTAKRLR